MEIIVNILKAIAEALFHEIFPMLFGPDRVKPDVKPLLETLDVPGLGDPSDVTRFGGVLGT